MSFFKDLEHLTMKTTRSFEIPKNHLPATQRPVPEERNSITGYTRRTKLCTRFH